MLRARLEIAAFGHANDALVKMVQAVDGGDDLEQRDLFWFSGQGKAAASTFGADQQALADQILKHLGDEIRPIASGSDG